MQGHSLKSVLTGTAPTSWRDALYYRYWMHLSHHHIPAHYGIRTDRYKLAFFYALPLDASLGKGNYEASTPGWELYDLKQDPNELNNVYGDPAYASVAAKLKKRLLELKQEYKDTDDVYPQLMKLREAHWDSY